MKVVIAIDSFKGSLSSLEAGNAIKEGILRVDREANVIVCPLADGGEGTVEALALGMDGRLEKALVKGPLSTDIEATYGIIDSSKTAIIEMASASGITLVPNDKRNPLETTTYGVGQLIKDAISKGCRNFIVGIGGSATNDGGVGMLQALGFEFLDANGNQISIGAKGLKDIKQICNNNSLKELNECSFRVACDVTNPLCGSQGCSAVFGPQKGATPEMIAQMDKWLSSYAFLTKEIYPTSDMSYPGSGAAGGLGFAFHSYLNASLESGVKIVLDETKLENTIKDADIIITGEGCLDEQTIYGKAPIGVAKLAKKYDKPVIAFSGATKPDATLCNEHGIDAFFPILRETVSLEEAMNPEKAYKNMILTTEQVFRLISTFRHGNA